MLARIFKRGKNDGSVPGEAGGNGKKPRCAAAPIIELHKLVKNYSVAAGEFPV